MTPGDAFKHGNALQWTLARISTLSVQEVRQLLANAERLNEPALAERCRDALRGSLSSHRQVTKGKSAAGTKARHLIARIKAFEARGVYLQDARTSWSGIRKADGKVVMALWADRIETADGTCRYLLWAPNLDGSRPWSDKAAGKERLDHCKRAIEIGGAEGLLVYGIGLVTHLPEDKAHAIHGVDAETVLTFQVEQTGEEFWAKWGKKAAVSN
ncbi:MAG TPA: hypothetical protein VL199_00725 [Burkholderiales bacterium]|jgi:hypothetical protein|nr:hypothetical protein [Burkholderiales bacterium]